MKWYSDVFDLVFPDIDSEQANNVWKKELTVEKAEPKENDEGIKDN